MDSSPCMLVAILYPLRPIALLLFPLAESISTVREGVGYEVLWPAPFVIDDEIDEVNVCDITNFSS